MRGNGPNLLLPQMQPQQPVMNIASPMNDVQLVSLVAAQVYANCTVSTPQDAVDRAVEIVAAAFAAQQKLGAMIENIRQKVEGGA